MKKILLFIVLCMSLIIVGCDKKVTVTFDSDGGTIIASQTVVKGATVDEPDFPEKEGFEFIGWFYDNKKWDFSFPVNSNITLLAKYNEILKMTGFTVVFMDYNGTTLKEEIVETGNNATPPENPTREGYLFTGWYGNYNNIQGNVIIKAQYISLDTEYKINYIMNNGIWGYGSKNDYVLSFLKDFYKFVKPSESEIEFIYGTSNTEFLGTWKNYIGGSISENNKLLYDNNLQANNEDYFFNSSLYKEKWALLGKWVQSLNTRFAGSGGYEYGALDFYRYIINDPNIYINVYGDKFYGYPEIEDPFNTYKYSNEAIQLPKPINSRFKGWYLNSDFTGEAITQIEANTYGDITLYASWDTTVTYEIYFDTDGAGEIAPITVEYNEEVTLPTSLTKDGYTFVGWYLKDTYINEVFNFNYPYSITLKVKWRNDTVSLENLTYNGNNVLYRNSSTPVQIPTEYVQPTEQLRATWVSSYASTFQPSPVEATMKANLTEVLDLLESYNMNCMIFHIRTLNNAYYQTDLAPIDSEYGTYESFNNWDYLEWLIDECHKRGMEFHAWLNPYRIKAYGFNKDATAKDVAQLYKDYPKNPASNPDNILMTYRSDGTQGAILNPCKEEVQDYIVNVCIEIMEKYNVDAIHFDDYFYAQMSPSISVLSEPDQVDYVKYIKGTNKEGYSEYSANDKKQWRRDNIDNFIYKLHSAITDFNIKNKKAVQLGISPTGIYRNGNGSVSSGSNTAGQEHYSSYLFCDTVNWVRNQWIDYIMPQSYWAFTHSVAGYADVMDWWNMVVEGTNVNLYSGLGLYMSVSGGNYSWGVQPYEISNQILYTTKLKNVKGVSVYSMLSLKQVNTMSSQIAYKGLMRVKNEYWNTKVSTPKTMAHQYLN